jgi:hypothetical protein
MSVTLPRYAGEGADRSSRILLTCDTLYPGLLVVNDWPKYVASIARLHAFVDVHPVSFVLGAHIEMTNQPGHWFGLGELFQPSEHVLQLSSAHLAELHKAWSSFRRSAVVPTMSWSSSSPAVPKASCVTNTFRW